MFVSTKTINQHVKITSYNFQAHNLQREGKSSYQHVTYNKSYGRHDGIKRQKYKYNPTISGSVFRRFMLASIKFRQAQGKKNNDDEKTVKIMKKGKTLRDTCKLCCGIRNFDYIF